MREKYYLFCHRETLDSKISNRMRTIIQITFSFVNILFVVSIACLKSSIGNSTQYNFGGIVFLNTSKICGSPYPRSVATCLMCVTYASIVSVFASKGKDHHAWNKCSLVLLILEYCCLNKFLSLSNLHLLVSKIRTII